MFGLQIVLICIYGKYILITPGSTQSETTNAINQAISEADPGDILVFKKGIYNLNSGIIIDKSIEMHGA